MCATRVASHLRTSLWWLCLAGSSLIAGSGAPVTAAEPELQKYEFLQIRMGVQVNIQVYAADEEAANNAAEAAYARFRALDRIMSDYDPDSELMQLCRNSGPGRPVKISPELAFVLGRSLELSRRSGGAFDVTVGPFVDLWRKARRSKQMPAMADVEAALARIGYKKLRVDMEQQTAELLQEGMDLDLGGIAIGYAADEALRIFQEHGLRRVLIDASGDIVVGDPPPGRDAWRIEIEPLKPRGDDQGRTLLLRNCAVTTSGDAYKFVEIDGVRYSHIVDPKNGLGLTTRSSATVIAPDCITADRLATSVTVLGPKRGLELVESTPDAALYFVQMVDEMERITTSPRFAEHLAEESSPHSRSTLDP
jgi:thiamine biosynthesis lipoprotein